jgi:class 3 adenylate cyclase
VETGIPKTRYAETVDGVDIAYQVFGNGPPAIVYVPPGPHSHVEVNWELPGYAAFMRGLASFARVICFDKRGLGMSDRITSLPNLESRVDDIRAVMDASHTSRAAMYGLGEGAALAAFFAATHPDRTTALIFDGTPRVMWAPDWPWGVSEDYVNDPRLYEILGGEDYADEFVRICAGDDEEVLRDPRFGRWLVKLARYSGTPKSMALFDRVWAETDVRDVLSSIHVPTLVLSAEDPVGAELEEREKDRWVAGRIPGAKLLLCPHRGFDILVGGSQRLVQEVEGFLSAARREEEELDRALATVLFTDLVCSTEAVAQHGDSDWAQLLGRHNATVRAMLARYRGTEVKTMGDGFLATFDGPARAVRCAQAICEAVKPLGLEVRAGCHTGEIEVMGSDVGGIAVHIAARVAALASPSEVLASSTVKDLVAGSGLTFVDRGEHELKGVPGSWRLYSVA